MALDGDDGNYDGEYVRQHNNAQKYSAGNSIYCSYGELHPVETAISIGVGLAVPGAIDYAIFGGGAETALWSLQQVVWKAGFAVSDAAEGALVWLLNKIGQNSRAGQVAMSIFDKMALHNPESSTMVIGQSPNYKITAQQNGYAYYDLPNIVHSALSRAGWAPANNANAILNSAQTGRTILIDAPTRIGSGLDLELRILNNLRYSYQWLNGPPSSP
jgi:hypothetical protein